MEPCSYCGTPCTGTYRFWFAGKDQDEAVEVDQHPLDSAFGDIVGAHDEPEAYAHLPAFIRGRNEDWEALSGGPVALDPADFRRVLAFLEERGARGTLSERQSALVLALRRLERDALAAGASIYFRDE